jgi:fimbrial chaperone protein
MKGNTPPRALEVNSMTKRILSSLLFIFLLLPALSFAGSFSILPLRVHLGEGARIETITITNQAQEKVTVKVKALEWTQEQTGKDDYLPTKDLIYFPRIVSIEGKGKQLIKLTYKAAPGEVEKAYRLFIEEVPGEQVGSEQMALRMTLRMSVPVFVAPKPEAVSAARIEKVELSGGTVSVQVTNTGNKHVFIRSVAVRGTDGEGKTVFSGETRGWYQLPGKSRTYSLKVQQETCPGLRNLEVKVSAQEFTLQEEIGVDPGGCLGEDLRTGS